MQSTELALRPSYWASVSGGKDSLFMLNLILHNLDKYPLDGVVHFELEIDYPFIKNVIDYMQSECERFGIRFVRIKPTKSWYELYERYGFPTRVARWCNDKYKLTAKKQLQEFMKKQGYYTVFYIGYCADEEKRFAKRVDLQKVERYPLVEESIEEDTVRTILHVKLEQKVEREQVAKVTGTNKDDTGVREPKKRAEKKVYPNDPCPCGSGKKYKQCCGRKN